jgi:cleavage and polyadenylation specificity factor subunit 2
MTETIQVKCNVLMIDLEGKADGRALKTIIPQINPKTVVSHEFHLSQPFLHTI